MNQVIKVIFLTFLTISTSNLFAQIDSENPLNTIKAIDSTEALAEKFLNLNDFNTAYKLNQKVLESRIQMLHKDDPDITISLAKLGQIAILSHQIDIAQQHMQEVSKRITKSPIKNKSIRPLVAFVHAKIYEALNQRNKAKTFYSEFKDWANNDKTLSKSEFYIDVLTHISRFHAFNYNPKEAYKHAHIAIEIAQKNHFNTYIHLKALRNISNMYFGHYNYKKGLKYSNIALELFHDHLEGKGDIKHQVQTEKIVPYLIWINVKSKYFLKSNKDSTFLLNLAREMDEGFKILNKNKSILLNPEDINILFEDYGLFFSFAKQLHLDLFWKTKNDNHLIRVLQMHESVLYSKIRKRLGKLNDLAFESIPESVSDQEKFLKENLKKTLSNPFYSNQDFIHAERKWSSFLDSLKTNYPKYYKLNYASVEQYLHNPNVILPEETIVRYLYIEKRLYAFVLSSEDKLIFPLSFMDLGLYTKKLNDYTISPKKLQPILNTLYHKLWRPFEHEVKTKKVIIIPDGALFNLNFDLLTKGEIHSFKDIAVKGLITDHTISYNYSLLLHNSNRSVLKFDKDFVAFAPEFNSDMKAKYEMAINDSIYLDRAYLKFLPQPFSTGIVQKFGKRFNGRSFLNNQASKQIFTRNAGEHKIIHIGTHAESNNRSPELSRLVFAKNVSDSVNINDNYLYTYEIYNQNLNSNLAILTACETGKPTYQPGEGMISLAHAFNYAGSESILTSLWQIDEQSSTQILEFFYTYLEDGKPKDEALRLAKLEYLKIAEGRTLHPQYWAGLVLMGETAPIDLNSSTSWWVWLVIAVLAIGITAFLTKRRRETIK